MTKCTCIFVVNGYEVDRKDMEHPGMDEVKHIWKERQKPEGIHYRKHAPAIEVEKSGVFYFDHMDARGNHVFRSTLDEKV